MADGGHIFISYKSQEERFALKLAPDLQNAGVQIWLDRLNGIQVSDVWTDAIDHALKGSIGLIAVLTPQYFESRVCQDELLFAYTTQLPIFPILLRKVDMQVMPFWLPGRQYLDYTDWQDEPLYQQRMAALIARIKDEQQAAFGSVPSDEAQYLNTLIAELESYQGVEEYVTLSGQADRRDPRKQKKIAAGLSRLVKESHEKEAVADIKDVLQTHSRFVLIGDPGAGKTTTMRRLALDAAYARREKPDSPIPVFAYLPRWRDEATPDEFLRTQYQTMKFNPGHNIQLYLDGLNEMGSSGGHKAKLLQEWLKEGNAPQTVIVTCRRSEYGGELDLKLPQVLAEELDDDRIRDFAAKYLGDAAEEFLKRVFAGVSKYGTSQRSLMHLARNPYLLTALITVFDASGDLPSNNGTLFQVLVEALWEREGMLRGGDWIPFDQMQTAFAKLAYAMIAEGKPIDVPVEYALQHLEEAELLKAGQSANLITVRDEQVRFYHQLMQEYFAAVRMDSDDFSHYLPPPRAGSYTLLNGTTWREVIIAVGGITHNVERLIAAITPLDPYLAAECYLFNPGVSVQIKHQIVDVLIEALAGKNTFGTEAYLAAQYDEPPTDRDDAKDRAEERENALGLRRERAANCLGQLRDPRAIPSLVEALLKDSYPDVMTQAAKALKQFDWQAPNDEQRVIFYFANDDRDAIYKMGIRAVEPLITLRSRSWNYFQRDEADELKKRALNILCEIDMVVPMLIDIMFRGGEKNPPYHTIIDALAQIRSPQAMDGLQKILLERGSSDYVIAAFLEIGTPEAIAIVIPQFEARLSNDEIQYGSKRYADTAAEELIKIGTPEALDVVVKWLIRELSNTNVKKEWFTQTYSSDAAEKLTKIGTPEAWAAVVPWWINKLMNDEVMWSGRRVADEAAEALTKIGTSEALAAVVPWWIGKLENYEIRSAGHRYADEAAEALTKIGTSEALAAVVPWWTGELSNYQLEDKYRGNRCADIAAEALMKIGTPEALAAVVPWWIGELANYEIKEKHSGKRYADVAAEALTQIGTLEALAAVAAWKKEQGNR